MARSALPAVLHRLADADVMDGDTENYLREAADRLEQCEDEAHQVLDAIAAAELELREHLANRVEAFDELVERGARALVHLRLSVPAPYDEEAARLVLRAALGERNRTAAS